MANYTIGIDINPNLVRASKMNMVMNNDGSGGLTQADSLRNPLTWSDEARKIAPLGEFDYLFTNPPFGTKIRIDDPDVLDQYDLAAAWDWNEQDKRWIMRIDSAGKVVRQGSQPPEILFIERSIQFLRPGTGTLAMVIPNGILNNPPLGYVRQWIIENAQVLAVVDMHRDLFQPKNDTQTSMVLLRRLAASEQSGDYPIFFAVTDKIGHDKRGNLIYKRDAEGNDIITTRQVVVKSIEDGTLVERTIDESGPTVHDELADIPRMYQEFVEEYG